MPPQPGDLVRLRTRNFVVEEVRPHPRGHAVTAACLDDDSQGQVVEVIWEAELGCRVVNDDQHQFGSKGFDSQRFFSAFVNALRWNCVSATDAQLFQSPFRAGIRIDAYQLEPLRMALKLPRVNVFIADDVGLGKTIEAGLIASELLLRKRVNEIVVICPPSMLLQWKDELESRFGLLFEILDRQYIERLREQRGYSINPWTTYPRFLVSSRLLTDDQYAGPLRVWLDGFRPGTLLILDEAHHAAPSSGSRYAIDSRITRAIRDLAPRFEHRLFLSATPHNGHSNSFSALLELLDPQRFSRGIKVNPKHLSDVMVRRLKDDLRELSGGFPLRKVEEIEIDRLPATQPELRLSQLLDDYSVLRLRQAGGDTKRVQNQTALMLSGLQQRLLSSVEAFARTLIVHRRTMERHWDGLPAETAQSASVRIDEKLLVEAVGADDDLADLNPDELTAREAAAFEAVTAATARQTTAEAVAAQRALLDELQSIAENARWEADAKIDRLVEWIRVHMCPGASCNGRIPGSSGHWTDRRLLIFTEYEATRSYIVHQLYHAIAGTELEDQRIEVFSGSTSRDKREQIKRAFNKPPAEHPVRILVATDAAREGLNLQAHCCDLLHFDVPWNPSRMEQRNGRIDRKLQPSPVVHCRYFFYAQRPEDRVLKALVAKTKTIRSELGSLASVLDSKLEQKLRGGIRHAQAGQLKAEIEGLELDGDKRTVCTDELESQRTRQAALKEQIEANEKLVERAERAIGLNMPSLQDALSCSLELLGKPGLQPAGMATDGRREQFALPAGLDSDPSWTTILDSLRSKPDEEGPDRAALRAEPVRPLVFQPADGVDDDTVQLHLQHRLVQRLLTRFSSQGFVHHELSRACLAHSADNIPRVILLGRLALYGEHAARLHEEIIAVPARWTAPASRSEGLRPYAREGEKTALELLYYALQPQVANPGPLPLADAFLAAVPRDIAELKPHLDQRGLQLQADAEAKLDKLGQAAEENMKRILQTQLDAVKRELDKSEADQLKLFPNAEEQRQFRENRSSWGELLKKLPVEIETEPARVRDSYRVVTRRIELVGIVYLHPAAGGGAL